MKRYQKKRTDHRICEWCLQAYEYHNGKQHFLIQIMVDKNDENASRCEFCKGTGFDKLYLL